jgi:serine/threonine protein kinase
MAIQETNLKKKLEKTSAIMLDEGKKKLDGKKKSRDAIKTNTSKEDSILADIELSLDMFAMDDSLGRGAYGTVMLASFVALNKYYAIKVMSKHELLQKHGVMHAFEERDVLQCLMGEPFIVQIRGTFQCPDNLYMVLDYCPGGELYTHVAKRQKLGNNTAKFYSAQILLALEAVHKNGYMYRDLKPENVVLDSKGNCTLVDFGFTKEQDESGRRYTSLGTPHYLAPEILDQHNKGGYTNAVDWWAFGCFIFELITGRGAFGAADDGKFEIYTRIMQRQISFPSGMDKDAKSLIKQLLEPDFNQRLSKAEAIKQHPWFQGLDWDDFKGKLIKPPYIPQLLFPGDKSHFDRFKVEEKKYPPLDKIKNASFKGF